MLTTILKVLVLVVLSLAVLLAVLTAACGTWNRSDTSVPDPTPVSVPTH